MARNVMSTEEFIKKAKKYMVISMTIQRQIILDVRI